MTIEELLEKYKRKYPGVPYEISDYQGRDYQGPIILSKKDGKVHSYNDAPSGIDLDGRKTWGKNGKRHRENDKPAIIHPSGAKAWFINGKPHRENDKPAVVYSSGEKKYYYHGEEYDPEANPKKQIQKINKLTPKKTEKQKQREDLLKEFVNDLLIHP